jgi:hypothetical protein
MQDKLRILNSGSGAVVADEVTLADTHATRGKGWLGRRSVRPGEAIWIRPCSSVHCFFMRFAIDVAFLDRDLRVVKIVPSLRPWRIAGALRARTVLELAAGALARSGTHVGDYLTVER